MNPRRIIADVAKEFVGVRETSPNQGPCLEKFWAATNYPNAWRNREPWCAAFAAFCVQEGDRRSPELRLRKPPVFPAVRHWLDWAKEAEVGCLTFSMNGQKMYSPQVGDIVSFLPQLSHIGIVAEDWNGEGFVQTVEGNTNAQGQRDGNGVWLKTRPLDFCGLFIRVPALGVPV